MLTKKREAKYFYHETSPINTLNKAVQEYQKANIKEIKKLKPLL